MPWYHHIAAFLSHNLPRMRATRRTNPALLAAAILSRHQRKSATSASFPTPALTPSAPNAP